jgi:hypothetical protein
LVGEWSAEFGEVRERGFGGRDAAGGELIEIGRGAVGGVVE